MKHSGLNLKSPNHKITKSPTTDHPPSFRIAELRRTSRSPYTLIEILMVIVIMALLMAVAMPAFIEMMKGQGVEAGARGLGQILKLARSHAINNREYVAVLMPQSNKNNAAYPASGIPSNYYDRTYRVCIVQKNVTGGYDFKRWIPGESWEFLSTGVAIFETDSDKGVTFTGNIPNNNTCILIDQVNFDDIQSGSTSVDDVAGIVFMPTGKSMNTDYYIDIGEGTFSGSSLVVTNLNPEAVVTLKIANFTGRVTYGDE